MNPSGPGAHARHGPEAPPGAHAEHAPADRPQVRGLASAEGNLRFEAEPTIVAAGEKVDFAFTIVGPDAYRQVSGVPGSGRANPPRFGWKL